jgi:hypothetical protein
MGFHYYAFDIFIFEQKRVGPKRLKQKPNIILNFNDQSFFNIGEKIINEIETWMHQS